MPPSHQVGRIMIVTPDIVGPVKNGGIGTACYHYARSAAAAGHHVDILFSGEIGETALTHWRSWYAAMGIGFHTLDVLPPLGEQRRHVYAGRWHHYRALRIFEFLRRRDDDYIVFQDWHANGYWAARAKRCGAAFSRTTLGLIVHSPNQWQKEGMRTFGTDPADEWSLEWAEKETIASVDVLVSPSRHMIGWLQAHGYALPAQVTVCPITYEDETRPPSARSVDTSHLIFFGRLETRKGLHLLGGALRELRRRGAALPRRVSCLGKLARVNEMPAMDYVRQLEADLGDVEIVVETDFDYLQAVDYIRTENGVVVIPSLLDNFPLTVLESIANGFCFVASDVGGIPEMVDPVVQFEGTVDGLGKKLEALATIDFAALRHPYSPAEARRTWLEHLSSVVAETRRAPSIAVGESPVPPVSVCIPFYRHDRYIGRLVSAFLRMNQPELQLVFVDDGTPPAQRQRFDAMARELDGLGHVFHHQANSGPGAARNAAIERARHDLLLFFDADNVPFPNLIDRLTTAMSVAGADSVAAPFLGVPPTVRMPVAIEATIEFRPPGGPIAIALIDNVLGDVCALVKREVVRAVGGFTETRQSWEDWEFFLRVLGHGYRHLVYPDPLFYYTLDDGGRNLSAAAYENRMSLFEAFRSLPAEILGETAELFAKQYLVTGR